MSLAHISVMQILLPVMNENVTLYRLGLIICFSLNHQ